MIPPRMFDTVAATEIRVMTGIAAPICRPRADA
jgi:hypothetical protein